MTQHHTTTEPEVAKHRDAVIDDLRQVIEDAQHLAAAAKDHSVQSLQMKKTGAQQLLRNGGERIRQIEQSAVRRAGETTARAGETVRQHPWLSLGVFAAALGVAGGLILMARKTGETGETDESIRP